MAEREPGMRNLITKDNKVYRFMQSSIQGGVLTSNTSVPVFYSKSWTSADIVQFSSFASIFDQYRIDKVEVWCTPFGAAVYPNYGANTRFYSVVDYDDANSPSTVAALQEYTNCVTTRCTEGHYIKFRPHIAVALYGGSFTQFGNKVSDWIDCGSTSVSHYGVKLGIEPTTSANDLRIDMFTRITVSFRNIF